MAGTSPAAKTSRLSSESEAVLLTLFGVQDMLGREDAQVLAQQVLHLLSTVIPHMSDLWLQEALKS